MVHYLIRKEALWSLIDLFKRLRKNMNIHFNFDLETKLVSRTWQRERCMIAETLRLTDEIAALWSKLPRPLLRESRPSTGLPLAVCSRLLRSLSFMLM